MESHKCADCNAEFRTSRQLRGHWSALHKEGNMVSGSGE
ncbi:uncharacterized protein METZ01_LOCUS449798 [marine metagenome]|uniref:C2H2-type domain-containing protein n=1 Tax=marine metagenome TaxID=408172 RepID=A0A382ZN92_9ZZZZ